MGVAGKLWAVAKNSNRGAYNGNFNGPDGKLNDDFSGYGTPEGALTAISGNNDDTNRPGRV